MNSIRIAVTRKNIANFVERVAAREPALVEPVARYLYKLMAYKDEYEVARLLTQSRIRASKSAICGKPWSLSATICIRPFCALSG